MKLNELANSSHQANLQPGSQSPFRERARDLETVLSVITKINTSLVLADVLALVIDHAIRITNSERGFLMLENGEGKLQYIIGHDKRGRKIHPENFQVSRSIVDDVFGTGESVCVENALNDERFEQRQSIMNLELETIMCAALKTHDSTLGVIYVDSRYIHSVRRDETLRMFDILAGQAAIAIQNAKLYEDIKKTYDELKEANEHIIASERLALRGEMAAEVSHELKNILGIALLQAQATQRSMKRGDNEASDRQIRDVVSSIQKINNFSENLLVRSGSQMLPVQLNDLVTNFVAFIHHLPKFRSGKIKVAIDETLPELQADTDQLQQVLLNLANNAIEACPEATITFSTEYDVLNNTARLTVEDNGPGLDPRVKEKAFVEKITTKPNGHGFGLPVCRKILLNHKGDIRVESQEGKGTTFILTLPVSS
jgi:signal transduction histidine kinase